MNFLLSDPEAAHQVIERRAPDSEILRSTVLKATGFSEGFEHQLASHFVEGFVERAIERSQVEANLQMTMLVWALQAQAVVTGWA